MKAFLILALFSLLSANAELSDTPNLDLNHQKTRVMREQGWNSEYADEVATEYRRFWQLHLKHPDTYLVPSLSVDEIWHAHILFTQQYADDCARVFGSFFHHFPNVDDEDTPDASGPIAPDTANNQTENSDYANTLQLYEQEFGMKPNNVWVSTPGSCGSNCGSNCGGNSTKVAGCGSCHGKRNKKAGCGNCHGKNKKAGCGNCHGKGKKKAGCGNCHGKSNKTAGCGNCHGKKNGGCGNCSGKSIAEKNNNNNNKAGCGNCRGTKAKSDAGCGSCSGK